MMRDSKYFSSLNSTLRGVLVSVPFFISSFLLYFGYQIGSYYWNQKVISGVIIIFCILTAINYLRYNKFCNDNFYQISILLIVGGVLSIIQIVWKPIPKDWYDLLQVAGFICIALYYLKRYESKEIKDFIASLKLVLVTTSLAIPTLGIVNERLNLICVDEALPYYLILNLFFPLTFALAVIDILMNQDSKSSQSTSRRC